VVDKVVEHCHESLFGEVNIVHDCLVEVRVHVSGLVVLDGMCNVLDGVGHVDEDHDLVPERATLLLLPEESQSFVQQACQGRHRGQPSRTSGSHHPREKGKWRCIEGLTWAQAYLQVAMPNEKMDCISS
jgi:hypothetical protein